MRRFGIICLLIFMLCLSTKIFVHLAVKLDSQLQNAESINYTSVIDPEIIEEANARNVSVESYLSADFNSGWLIFFLFFGTIIFIHSLLP